MKKNILTAIAAGLSVMLIASCGGKSPKANPASDFKYEMTADGAGIRILDYIGESSKIIIPEMIEDMPVLEITGLANNNVKAKNGDHYNDKITAISIPSTVRLIGTDATNIRGQREVQPLHQFVYKLDSLTLPATDYEGGLAIISDALTEFTFPEGKTKIGDCFKSCKNLKKITLPSTVKEMSGMISCNKQLNEIEIPESVESIKFTCTDWYVFNDPSMSNQFDLNALSLKTQQKLKSFGYKGHF